MFCPSCGVNMPDSSIFCLGCGRKVTGHRGLFASRTSQIILALVIIGGGVYALLARSTVNKLSPKTVDAPAAIEAPLQPAYVPRTMPLLSTQVAVPHGTLYSVPFTIDAERMRSVKVTGRYSATGGSGNDIQVFITDPDGFENLRNGHQARVWYPTDKVTVGEINVPLTASGSYLLVMSNRFSAISDKYVTGSVELKYEEKQ